VTISPIGRFIPRNVPLHPLNRGQFKPQIQAERFRKEKNLLAPSGIRTLEQAVRILVTILTMISQLLKCKGI
jgi:hypothetical protein